MAGKTHKLTKAEIREKFIGEHYPVHIVGRQMDLTDAMKDHIFDKLAKIDHFGARVIDVTVILSIQRGIHTAEILIYINDKKILSIGRDREMYAAIDHAVNWLKNKLSRYHKHLHEYDRKEIDKAKAGGYGEKVDPIHDINDQIDETTLNRIEEELKPHPITHREKREIAKLSEEEAIWKMEKNIEHSLLFINEASGKMTLIYRLHDGNYGVIETV